MPKANLLRVKENLRLTEGVKNQKILFIIKADLFIDR
jgi:hypothetical protein